MNDTFRIALRAMVVAAMTLLASSTVTAQNTPTGPRVHGNVYGGGNLATVGGSVTVNMKAGTVEKDVYGGGALANTNINNATNYGTENETVSSTSTNTTTVNLTGGTIMGDAYGGGLGRIEVTAVAGEKYTQEEIDAAQEGDPAYGKTTDEWKVEPVEGVEGVEATVYGDINVNLGSNGGATATAFNISTYDGTNIVKSGRVFGCNNLNGSPHGDVTVTVYKTVKGSHDKTPAGADGKAPKTVSSATSYRVAAVYGGGNLANYEPTATGKKSHVIIYGCSDTSIEYVYGGGNAAAVPETDVDIYEAYEIGTVFGGGNGKDQYTLDGGTTWKDNAGANVNGNATTMLYGGLIHEAFGGSNERGKITGNVAINTDPQGTCTLDVGTIYGAGKNADIDGDLIVTLGCMPENKKTDAVYGGAENANVKGNVELTITSGKFGKVFGGNNQSGAIFGSITLNIMESGCSPIEIDELYLGGNQAAYSVYGYYKAIRYENGGNYYLDASHKTPLYVDGSNLYLDENKEKRLYPQNETVGTETITYLYLDEECTKPFYMPRTSASDSNAAVFFGIPSTDDDHTKPNTTTKQYADPVLNIVSATKIGKVFGGGLGSGAALYGNPTVNINQAYPLEYDSYSEGVTTYKKKNETFGAIGGGYGEGTNHVDGGVFGGGNEAAVYGNTTLNIGTKTTVDWKVLVLDNDKKPILDDNGKFRTQTLTGADYNTVIGANIAGNVYGGGNLADVTGSTEVNICAKEVTSGTTTSWQSVTPGTAGVIIAGNVYGGGKGVARESGARAFFCEEAMVGENDTNSAENNDDPAYADYGTHVRIGNGTIGNGTTGGNVYGGGEIGRVEFHTEVVIGLGEGTGETTKSPVINGSVFGAGKGNETHGYAALVRGNSTVTVQGNAEVESNVYGGGEMSTVGRYWVKGINNIDSEGNPVDGAPEAPSDLPVGMPYKQQSGGICRVIVKGSAQIGPDAGASANAGHVFGAGKGVEPSFKSGTTERMVKNDDGGSLVKFEDKTDETTGKVVKTAEELYLEFLQTLALVTNSNVTIDGSANVKGSVYGGSESGFVQHDTKVEIKGGTVNGDAFGGGLGLDSFAEAGKVKGNTDLTVSGGAVQGNVYGGGSLGDVGIIDKTEKKDGKLTYNYHWKKADGTTDNDTEINKKTDLNTNTGICTVTISGGTIGISGTVSSEHGNVFGAGKGTGITWWCEKAIAYATNVTITAGTVNGNVYGGGQVGRVEDDGKVTIGTPNETGESKPAITGDVFGAGAGLHTHGYSALLRGNAEVTVQGTAQIGGSVYGGGETASVGRFTVVGGLPKHPDSGGYCTVNIKDNAKIGSSGTGHNVYGACKGVDPTKINASERKSMQLYSNRPKDANGNYKAENDGWVYYRDENNNKDERFVWVNYTEAEYPAFLRTLALTSHPHVTIAEDASVYGSVYGGGEMGLTLGSVDVDITGGTIEQDVYGGGALADTNAGNWDADSYTEVTGLTAGQSSVIGLYERSGAGTDTSPYTYTVTTDETAVNGKTYCSKGKWADASLMTAKYTTSVDLTGGIIKGDAYGGGLGDLAERGTDHSNIEAVVYGDVSVTLGTLPTSTGNTTTPGTATAFHVATIPDDEGNPVVSSGRVFGCNNLNGSPKGSVLVTVNKTVAENISRTAEDPNNTGRPPMGDDSPANRSYEVAAVYGGGNLSDYEPYSEEGETEKRMPRVRFTTCDISVKEVYGGGNAAKVPATDVLIQGAYEIENVFGGGNGADKYTLDGGLTWKTNNGADVGTESNPGDANTLMLGGYIHSAYGGSNSKGDIFGTVYIDKSSGGCDGCPVQVDKMVAAGNNADFNRDVKVVVGCQGSDKTPMRFFGADNANVNGNVEVTITSGNFGQVFAGNNIGGAIRGHIIMNIEETSDCEPIRIDELYLGGNMAAYSRFGYYVKTTTSEGENATGKGDPTTETAALENDRLVFMPRKSEDDPHYPVDTYNRETNTWTVIRDKDKYPLYDQPVLNVISCTEIKEVFGGGYGVGGDMYANPTVNINMIPGKHAEAELGGSHKLGEIGNVYGGGNQAAVVGDATINIGTAITVNVKSWKFDGHKTYTAEERTVEGAYITGNVYGGGNLANITGNTFVNICAVKNDNPSTTDVVEYSPVAINGPDFEGVNIKGNVFGGGKGKADTFTCEKAMIGEDGKGLNADYTDGNTNVAIGNGIIDGTVYGGGEIGRVERNTTVTIGFGEGMATGTPKSAPEIKGNVYGAGAGEEEHGYAALVRGNPTVIIKGNAKIGKSVYGGGEIASVARYKVAETVAEATEHGVGVDMPYVLDNNDYGHCVVTIGGYAEIGPDNMKMYHEEVTDGTDKPDDAGHVFGAGKGVLPKVYAAYGETNNGPRRMILAADKTTSIWEYFANEEKYFEFIRTLALATETQVTIGGHAFVKGSVYGGSENGLVQYDTDVTIRDHCQIGQGKEITTRYEDYTGGNLFESTVPPIKSGSGSGAVYYDLECASWDYDPSSGAPYDPNANATGDNLDKYPSGESTEGGRRIAKDGHTFYGNVFGGGSGSVPYYDTNLGKSRYIMSAGWVKGNTNVTISGGHILTNVYGGNEATNVDGTATVKMTDGTIGVPRTLAQIDAHPVTCYLFGAGKGDQRIFFNKDTNVKDAVVEITGGKIYGSVFGGGEDGHVLRDVKMTIGAQTTTGEGAQATTTTSGPIIGTWGTSYVDGNVFGGGRGFGGDAYTAGNVAGSIKMEIKGGTMLGSIYGGGRLASVGYGLYKVDESGYGLLRSDNMLDNGTETTFFTTDGLNKLGRGHIDITISGGIIGNNLEYIVPKEGNIPSGLSSDYSSWEPTDWDTWLEHNHISKTLFDTSTGRLMHTKGGNVFTGGMGRREKLDGVTPIPYDASDPATINWHKLGNAKTTKVTISGTAWIKSNVYGGGELGAVRSYYEGELSNPTKTEGGNTEVIINGGTIGSMIGPNITGGTKDVSSTSGDGRYTFGSVYGGGYGTEKDLTDPYTRDMETFAALILDGTKVTMNGGTVLGSVFGGGELACVGGSSTVEIKGGTVGVNEVRSSDGYVLFGGSSMGNVYGGGSGSLNAVNAGLVRNNTTVNVSGSSKIYHNIYGGGAYGSVGWFTFNDGVPTACSEGTGTANVTVSGGQIGINGYENGMVFGSSRGDVAKPVGNPATDPNDKLAWVRETHVVIGEAVETSGTGATGDVSEPKIMGTVYGSGENGHVFTDTQIDVLSGTIGIVSGSDIKVTNEDNTTTTYSGAAYPNRGNVYGGGCGTDMYDSNGDGTIDTFNPSAGIVLGNATVNINGGTVVRNVYGAGAMGSVGKTVTTTANNVTTMTISGGTTNINVSGGTIGVDGTNGDGNVFGAARGNENATINEFALVKKETSVSVTGGTIKGNVYGGGELGCVGTFTVSQDMRTFDWQDTNGANNTTANSANKNTGVCNVTVDGSSAVINGHVYGAGRGKDDTFWCEKGIAYSTNVNIKNGTVGHNVYGGGEVGRVETNTQVKIGNGIGTAGGTFAPTITGSVFGGGAGVETHGYSALVRGNTTVSVEGNAKVKQSVYGGGQIASVGRYALDSQKMPSILQGGGYCYVTVQGHATIGEDVFGAGKGVTPHFNNFDEDLSKQSRRMSLKDGWEQLVGDARFDWDYLTSESDYSTYLETLALATHPEVTIDGNATVSGSVFGGGELGLTKGSVIVNIHGGTIAKDVYGGGSLANTNTTNSVDNNGDGVADETVDPTTTVNLKGGTINRNVYGGGLGRLAKEAQGTEGEEGYQSAVSAVEAKVYGEVLVNLNKPTTTTTGEGEGATTTTTYGDCEVKGTIFGCNNLNGSPQKDVTVHVYKTVKKNNSGVIGKPNKDTGTYELTAVYGGGNLAAYYPDDATTRGIAQTNVIIDGCDLTSIKQVYGGGNAASVPATHVVVNGTYEIEEVFGGGNGLDKISKNGTLITNPGANVGFKDYWDYENEKDLVDYDTKEERLTNQKFLSDYVYGSGKASVDIYGGLVHRVFGGSNTRGNVREAAVTMLQDMEGCDFKIDEAYGGGKSAPMDAEAKLLMACIPGLSVAYGGAQDADVQGGVTMTITNGTFDRVFGGNNISGTINGPIVVNIEETGCRPIVIGQLYGGGNQAAYTALDDGEGPTLNVHSFTSIGEIYGGGYGETAVVKGDTHVNIDVTEGKWASKETTQDEIKEIKFSEFKRTSNGGFELDGDGNRIEETKTITVTIPGHKKDAIGAIGNVFGGGNAAKVDGNTNVNIGTKEDVYMAYPVESGTSLTGYFTRSGEGTESSPYTYSEATGTAVDGTTYYKKFPIKGADIRGNVYGGGNNAEVTGNTNVVIGKEAQ